MLTSIPVSNFQLFCDLLNGELFSPSINIIDAVSLRCLAPHYYIAYLFFERIFYTFSSSLESRGLERSGTGPHSLFDGLAF